MHAQRDSGADRGQQMLIGDVLFVYGVPDFVNRRIDAIERAGFIVSCCDPHVVARTHGERMNGYVEAASVPVVREVAGNFFGQLLLQHFAELADQRLDRILRSQNLFG